MNDILNFFLFMELFLSAPALVVAGLEYASRVSDFNDVMRDRGHYNRYSDETKYKHAMRVKEMHKWLIAALLWPVGVIILLVTGAKYAYGKTSNINTVIRSHEAAIQAKKDAEMRAEIERQREKVKKDRELQKQYELMKWDEVFDDLSKQIGAK